jgi:hypothetical protein
MRTLGIWIHEPPFVDPMVRPHQIFVKIRRPIPRLGRGIAAVLLLSIAGFGVLLWVMYYSDWDMDLLAQMVFENRPPLYFRFIIPGHELEVPGRIGLLLMLVVPLDAFRAGLAFAWSVFTVHEKEAA